ncbi:MAG: hypothetical protein M3462_11530, partial [Chloroflexota bacterium]|nr:hypothetical protein [Chloroflexota bacterium]
MTPRFGPLSRRAALRNAGTLSVLAAGRTWLPRSVPAEPAGVPVDTASTSPSSTRPRLRTFDLTAAEVPWDLMPG